MNFYKYYALLCIVCLVNSTLIRKFLQITDKTLLKSICKVIHHVTDQKIQTQDILIGSLVSELGNYDVNDVIRCISNRHPAIVSDLTLTMTSKHLRKASLVILTLNKTDIVWEVKLKLV